MVGDQGASIEAVMVWVSLDPETNRPVVLGPAFAAAHDSAGGRQISARLVHDPGPPSEAQVEHRPWVLRSTDFDLYGHVNNAAAWAMVEQVRGPVSTAAPYRAEMEYRVAVEPGCRLALDLVHDLDGTQRIWARGHGSDADDAAPPTLFTTASLGPPRDRSRRSELS